MIGTAALWTIIGGGAVALVAGIVAIMDIRMASSPRRRARFVAEVVIGVAGVAVAASGAILDHSDVSRSQSPNRVSTTQPNRFQISRPSGDVPECTTIRGIGAIPQGKDLWIVVRPSDSTYWFVSRASANHGTVGGWVARQVYIGGKLEVGYLFTLYAVLVDSGVGNALASMNPPP